MAVQRTRQGTVKPGVIKLGAGFAMIKWGLSFIRVAQHLGVGSAVEYLNLTVPAVAFFASPVPFPYNPRHYSDFMTKYFAVTPKSRSGDGLYRIGAQSVLAIGHRRR